MTDPDGETFVELPEWAEQFMAREREYWSTLRDGGAASEAELWRACGRQWGLDNGGSAETDHRT